MVCAVIDSSHLIGKKYSVVIIEEIALNSFQGFNAFLRKAEITPRTLSLHLRDLEKSGIVTKNNNGGKSEYNLTDKGKDLHRVILSIKKWNIKWGNVPNKCLTTPCTECNLYKS